MHNERFNNGQQIQQQQLDQIHLLQQQHLQQAQQQLHQMQQQQAQQQADQQQSAPGSGRKKSRGAKKEKNESGEKVSKKANVEVVSIEEALKALTLTPEGACSAIKTPVSVLQELLSRRGITPTYDLVQIEGAIHEPTFRYRVAFADKDG